jgi:hypothetical protein
VRFARRRTSPKKNVAPVAFFRAVILLLFIIIMFFFFFFSREIREVLEQATRFDDRKPKRFSSHSTFACALLTCVLPSTLVGARKPGGRCTARQVVPTQW